MVYCHLFGTMSEMFLKFGFKSLSWSRYTNTYKYEIQLQKTVTVNR